ncbi:multiple antibiotic resistance regulatory protein MarB [Shimwellia pseudoproteus]|uniref:multiple antibiotic resistance regulatory protein MarB n=1 Tax=Shimwellia pseudoproteus TaxID=570012 RepID=UPI0018EBE2E9|nr:multiple antibiotic resistance regulatory protein MarB [Shimwellia pseudoproteus]MBJ3813685.1 multiple antibiotic resistance regulatory protein MarB [Shimwellia pseudoproteus]
MKRLICAITAVLALASTQVMAEQPEGLTWQVPDHGGMMLPSTGSWCASDNNQTQTNTADKSDALGVPYYHQK